MKRALLLLLIVMGLALSPLACRAADLTLHGVVTDVDGHPVQGAEVAIYRTKNVKKPADFVSSLTTADGTYALTVPAASYWAVAVLRKGEKRFGPLDFGDKHSGEAVVIEIAPGAELTHDFRVMDLREAAKQNQKKNTELVRLSGRLLDAGGKPLAMAYAVADKGQRVKEMPTYLSAWSDDSGSYLLLVPKGHLYLGAATAYPPAPEQALEKEITLENDQEGVDLVVPKP